MIPPSVIQITTHGKGKEEETQHWSSLQNVLHPIYCLVGPCNSSRDFWYVTNSMECPLTSRVLWSLQGVSMNP